ncbi:hypothetical protein FE634_00290 [Nocardioides dongxiaopingii]|uniref:hypothetical protein n=1 Tax=Nocardioides sp. S-1144 TaxID=2582905 RepID=UPI00110F61E8|nr:hypothetical protein [Nocardioides sp. S-1144]QCW49241.1 hypothetical protein FE634_00290 [Nocardioides sp. S-1144]
MDPTPPPPHRPVIRSQADLERAWRHLVEPLGFSAHSTWMMLIDAEDHPLPQLTQVEDCDRVPEPEVLTGFAELAAHLLDDVAPGGRWAFLRSRPGAGVTDVDRAWARGLVEACRELGVPTEVVHLATDVDLLPLPLDSLAA